MKISDLLEARPENIKFQEKKKKGVIDRVIAELKGHDSAKFTRIGKKYYTLDLITKDLARKKEKINTEVKTMFNEYFDVEDEVYTRVIDSAQVTLTLTKGYSEAVEAKEGYKVIKYEQLVDELYEMLDDKLKVILIGLKEKYTVIEGMEEALPPKKITPRLLTPKIKKVESVNEEISIKVKNTISKLKEFGKKFLRKIKIVLNKYDDTLDKIEFKALDLL